MPSSASTWPRRCRSARSAVRPGPVMAAADSFGLDDQGQGRPRRRPARRSTRSRSAAQIIVALQTIVSREVNPIEPAVITVGCLPRRRGGQHHPRHGAPARHGAHLRHEVRQQLALAASSEVATRRQRDAGRGRVYLQLGLPAHGQRPGDDRARARASRARSSARTTLRRARAVDGRRRLLVLPREPARLLLHRRHPQPDEGLVWGHHHPRFDIDEEGMGYGMETMVRTVLRYLADA